MGRELRILIVDDDHLMGTTLVDILTVKGYQSQAAHTGYDALQRLAEASFDCVLTDIIMPGINGVDLLKTLKPVYPDLPVVFMTAYSSDDLVEQGLDEGAIAILTKPVDIDLFLKFLSALERRPSVIVAHSDSQSCSTVAGMLQMHGYSVSQTRNPSHLARQLMPQGQVVLLDMRLDEAGGLGILAALREKHHRVSPILVTGPPRELKRFEEHALRLGAYACLHEPVDPQHLLLLLTQIRLQEARALLREDSEAL